MQAISYSQARQILTKTMTAVVENYEPVLILALRAKIVCLFL